MALLSVWWVWIAAAVVLGILELLAPGFLALGFAIGALAMAALVISPLTPSGVVLLVLFAAFSLAAWYGLRAVFSTPKGSVQRFEDDINDG